MIYLDNNASTRLDPAVGELMAKLAVTGLVNPASQHQLGRSSRRLLEDAREKLLQTAGARMVGMEADQFVFTSGGTESNNLAIFGMMAELPGAIVVSAMEHPSVLGAAEYLEKSGRLVRYLPVDKQGLVRLDILKDWIRDHLQAQEERHRIGLVSLMAANNETGVIQPIQEVARICREAGILCHTDAVQAFGKIPTSFRELGVDAMTITAHKIHGPVGIGGLVFRKGISIQPRLFGGFQQLGMRPGTEPIVLACGFARAAELAVANQAERSERMRRDREWLEQNMLQRCPRAIIHGSEVDRLPHTISIALPPADRQMIQMALDVGGIACSTGSACASGSSQPSHVLTAMGIEEALIRSSIRLSLSHETTREEIEKALQIIQEVDRSLNHG